MVDNLEKKIATAFTANTGVPIEVEARFGHFSRDGFIPGIPLDAFKRIENFFLTLKVNSINSHSTDYSASGVRKSVIDGDNPRVIWIKKNKIEDIDDNTYDYNIRYSISSEIPIQPVVNFIPTYERVKHRQSYFLSGNDFRIDLTIVMTNKTSYEVEIELLNQSKFKQFTGIVKNIMKIILNTNVLYTSQDSKLVLTNLNRSIGVSDNKNFLDANQLVQARNLHLKDMVWGGLIGNIIQPNKQGKKIDNPYTVTHKADGVRKLLFIDSSGIWYIAPSRNINLITKTQIPAFYKTVLDGEDIPLDKRNLENGAPKTPYYYIPFDCLSNRGDYGIQNKSLSERLIIATSATREINSIIYNIETQRAIIATTKDFRSFTTPNEFYDIMKSMFAQQNLLTYQQDGFLFTPFSTPYNSHSDKFPQYERVLNKHPDICKWKRKEEMTIDFEILWSKINPDGSRNLILLSKEDYPKKGSIVFSGTKFNPYDSSMVDVNNKITIDLPSGTIVEYAWDFNKNMLYPYRTRPDKTGANRISVAKNNWDWIFNPVSEETLTGDNIKLAIEYHKRIKNELFNFARGKTLLDIGSGKGGDISRWKHYDKIVAVEPNEENIIELERRIILNKFQDKVMIVKTGGQDTKIITKAVNEWLGGPADVISMMLSLSFFWSDNEIYQGLINTIRKNLNSNGIFIFLTIDGDAVEQTFDPEFHGPVFTKLDLNGVIFNYQPPELIVDIPGTIVGKQVEWLVRIGDLIKSFDEFGYKIKDINTADKEKFLSDQEFIYTKMYSYGIFIPSQKLLKPRILEKMVDPIKDDIIHLPKTTIISPRRHPSTLDITPIDLPEQHKVNITEFDLTEPTTEDIKQIGLPEITTFDIAQNDLPETNLLVPIVSTPVVFDFGLKRINTNWENKIVKIPTIGDGNCFIHSLLTSFYKSYQDNNDIEYRKNIASKLRRDIAVYLTTPSPIPATVKIKQLMKEYSEKTGEPEPLYPRVYDTFGDGVFISNVINSDPEDRYTKGIYNKFRIGGLQKLFNSCRWLGDEVYKYISDLMGVNIIVVEDTTGIIRLQNHTISTETKELPIIVIIGSGFHFESLGLDTDFGIQTIFFLDNEFIQKLIQNLKLNIE